MIRTRNEEKWIGRCLTAISMQDVPQFEIVLVDNDSVDGTLEIAGRFGCRVVSIPRREFRYGKALNLGIEHATGEYVAIVSGHCIPTHDHWLASLVANFSDKTVAGVYGRQVPLPDSDAVDKRDLWTTFGVERRVQRTEHFFHNANSMIRRDVWQELPFDDALNGVEDRDWALKMVERGYTIVYEPLAAVHHHHGIHQTGDPKRAERVVRVIEMINAKPRPRQGASKRKSVI